jgi:predicted RNA-binding Zn-ribbon protein involved in translation (DUF1610 family)
VARRTKGAIPIFDSVGSSPLDDRYETGATPGEGTFFCLTCGSQLSMRETDELPDCPSCGGAQYRRDSIFESRQDHGGTTSEFAVPTESGPPGWLDEAREQLEHPGHHLARREESGEIVTFAIERGWTRIGRSARADLRLDDPSVSRRHAMVVAEPGKPLRVLDDRSLNGLLVNGETVEWGPLHDGDELTIGCHHLYVLQR